MRPRSRILLLTLTAAVLLAFTLVLILDRPGPRPSAGAPETATGAASAAPGEGSTSPGYAGALLPDTGLAPDFTLTDQQGRRVSLREYRGRVTILTFLSTACSPTCPLIAQQLRGALDERGGNPAPTLIVSAAPGADTPARVRGFLAEAGLAGRVEFLGGSRAELRPVWRAYGIVPTQLADASSPHAASVMLLDRSGAERDLFQVEELTPEGLAHDLGKLEGG